MIGKSITIFRLLGFQVKVDASWLLLAVLVTWTLAVGVFPSTAPHLPQAAYWWMGIGGTLGLLVSIVFHELCHSLVARHFGLPMRGITLFIFGGVAEMEDEPPSARAEFLMAGIGPLASIAIALVLYGVSAAGRSLSWALPVLAVTHYLAYLNLILAFFNLVPAFPLDGGRMLRATLWGYQGDMERATRISSQIGVGFGIALIVLGLFAVLEGNLIGGIWWFLIGMFVRIAAKSAYQQLLVRDAIEREPVSRFMNRTPVTVPAGISVQQLVDDYMYRYHFKMFPVVDGDALVGCVTTTEVKSLAHAQWPQLTVRDILVQCSPDSAVSPSTSALAALSSMSRSGRSRLMVVDQGRLVGILSLKDLMDFLAIRLELK
ncbi:MAG: site-2 protease family protein [Betaproteobacteria bacterium]|nr:site-2 protease family protein [Betaproteobacteria bacterium]